LKNREFGGGGGSWTKREAAAPPAGNFFAARRAGLFLFVDGFVIPRIPPLKTDPGFSIDEPVLRPPIYEPLGFD